MKLFIAGEPSDLETRVGIKLEQTSENRVAVAITDNNGNLDHYVAAFVVVNGKISLSRSPYTDEEKVNLDDARLISIVQ